MLTASFKLDSPATLFSYPPRLSMDDYADFVEASLADCDPVRAALQKKIEKRIRMPFRMSDDMLSAVAPATLRDTLSHCKVNL